MKIQNDFQKSDLSVTFSKKQFWGTLTHFLPISRKTCPAPTFAHTLSLPDPCKPKPLLYQLAFRDKEEILHKKKKKITKKNKKHWTKSAESKC